ncbi:MAG: archaetidylserine decarboxylase [Pseudomonadota bacterium]
MIPSAKIFAFLQEITPTKLVTNIAGHLATIRIPFIKNALIRTFVNVYKVDLSEAQIKQYQEYSTFNAFFTRYLQRSARPLAAGLISPADGVVSQCGAIDAGKIIQAKGKRFAVDELLDQSVDANLFDQGSFATIYLSPRDYHRVHMPIDGELISTHHIPGRLFSVNDATAQSISRLFCRNERIVCLFRGTNGYFVMVLVGAMVVGGIGITPLNTRAVPIFLKKGEELGVFYLGSTVVLLTQLGMTTLSCNAGQKIKMGENLGS